MSDSILPVLELKRPITKQELADWGGWTLRYIDKEVHNGNLKKRFAGRGSRFMPSDVQDWLDRRASKVTEVTK